MPEGVNPVLLSMEQISKSFGDVSVLRNVSFHVAEGEVHVLAGENGAGKSTLMKILAGVYNDYHGQISLSGQAARFGSPADAARAGVSVIYQEMSLIGTMSIADNLFLGREHNSMGWLRRGPQTAAARKALETLGLNLDVNRKVEEFPIGVRQLLEIAKAVSLQARVLVMDEPTSALGEAEVERLFTLIAQLKAAGCGIVYISHKMQEIYQLADRITVLRDGAHVITGTAAELPANELVRHMVGRELRHQFARKEAASRDSKEPPLLEIREMKMNDPGGTHRRVLDGVSLDVHRGEIVALAGLQGSGCSELLNALFGTYGAAATGDARWGGKPTSFSSPRVAISRGIALLTNDRKETGALLERPIRENITLASLWAFSPAGIIRKAQETRTALDYQQRLHIRAHSVEQPISSLSGGNQQKVLLAKWLVTKPRLLLLDEPTRGVDVGAKHEIYDLIFRLRDEGCAILLVTTEMPELLALADRIVVLHRGRVTAELAGRTATQEQVLSAAMGETEAAA
jgi:ABC-type sugar transport system ATPase subunit